jgi:membrane protease YdiL (CAAX protease family)
VAADAGRELALSAVLAVGAGVYEELVFRLLLMRGTLWLLQRVAGMHGVAAGAVAVATSSLIFALFHHVGPGAEPFTPEAFTFRSLAGLLLAGLFAFRGLAVAVYAHAFYDLLLL